MQKKVIQVGETTYKLLFDDFDEDKDFADDEDDDQLLSLSSIYSNFI